MKEKEVFSSFVKAGAWHRRNKESMAINKIAFGQVKGAPDIKTVLYQFNKLFNPKNVILSYYGGPLDMDFTGAYHHTGLKWQFDYHYFNLLGRVL